MIFINKFTDYNETMQTQQAGIKMMSHAEKIKDMFKILVVEDDINLNDSIKIFLSKKGIELSNIVMSDMIL